MKEYEANHLKMIKTISSFMDRCIQERMTGELILRVVFNQGGIRNMEVRRIETVTHTNNNTKIP
jgi:hypothetical protein